MDLRIAARMLVVLALCAATVATLLALRGVDEKEGRSPPSAHPGGEPARSELMRCRDLGEAALRNEACRRAWAQMRRRFLRQEPAQ